jgi:hypothetical protein
MENPQSLIPIPARTTMVDTSTTTLSFENFRSGLKYNKVA